MRVNNIFRTNSDYDTLGLGECKFCEFQYREEDFVRNEICPLKKLQGTFPAKMCTVMLILHYANTDIISGFTCVLFI